MAAMDYFNQEPVVHTWAISSTRRPEDSNFENAGLASRLGLSGPGGRCIGRGLTTPGIELDRRIIFRSAVVLCVPRPHVNGSDEQTARLSCTKIGDVPKSPVPMLAPLVPSVGTTTRELKVAFAT